MNSPVDLEHPLAVKIRKQMVVAISRFNMIEDGDRVMVCCSGGKDSTILLALLNEIRKRAPYEYSLEGVLLDQKQPGFDAGDYLKFIDRLGVKLTVVERDTYSIVKSKITGGVYCSLCSRLRRAILYDHAVEQGFTKMALGHHRDDLNQTLLLNLFYTGKMASMPAKLRSDDGRNILLRPLVFVEEKDLISLAKIWGFPVIPCNLCGSQTGMKRQRIKQLIRELEAEIPMLQNSMLTAQANVRRTQLLDAKLCDFSALRVEDLEEAGLDHFTGLSSNLD